MFQIVWPSLSMGMVDMQICRCGATLPYILSTSEVLQSRGRFLCLKHALDDAWRETVLEYEAKKRDRQENVQLC